MNERARLFCVLLGCAVAAETLWPSVSMAGNQEPAGINLGSTSFYDGFGRNEEGFTYLLYAAAALSGELDGDDGKPAAVCNAPPACLSVFNSPRFNVFSLVNQVAYVLPEKLFNDTAHLGITFILPLVVFDTKFLPTPPVLPVQTLGNQLNDNGVGFGDLTFGPFMQFRPIMAGGRPVFSHRAELDLIVPIGKYDPQKDINQGANFWSFNPYWAMTVLPLPNLEVSARFHYLYNFKNYRPALGRLYGLQTPPENAAMSGLASAQAGQAVWVNFTLSYELLHLFGAGTTRLHLGANGYYFQQLNLDKWEYFDGSSVSGKNEYADGGKASVLGIGPGAMLELGKDDKLMANVYFQTLNKNRAEATVFNLHWIHPF